MILTSEQLEQIIKEETEAVLNEAEKLIGMGRSPDRSVAKDLAVADARGKGHDITELQRSGQYDEKLSQDNSTGEYIFRIYKIGQEELREVDMKKIGQGIKQTSKKMGQGVKQAVGKLKKKPAQPAPPVEPPLPPDGVSYDPTTKQWQARKTVTVDLAEYPFNFSQSDEDSIRYELEHMLQDNGWPGGSSDLIRKPRPDRGAGKMEVQFTLLAGAREDARNAEMRKRMGLEERT